MTESKHDELVKVLKEAQDALEPFRAVAYIFRDRTPQHGDVIQAWEFTSGSAELRISHCVKAAFVLTKVTAALAKAGA